MHVGGAFGLAGAERAIAFPATVPATPMVTAVAKA